MKNDYIEVHSIDDSKLELGLAKGLLVVTPIASAGIYGTSRLLEFFLQANSDGSDELILSALGGIMLGIVCSQIKVYQEEQDPSPKPPSL